jgi:hypothetical protein
MQNITRVTSVLTNVDCSTFSSGKSVAQNFILWNRLLVKRNIAKHSVFQVRKSLTNYTSAPSTRHWNTTYLETLLYTVRWSFDIMFHQSLVHMIEHVFELDCDPPMSTDISYRWWNLNCSLYCNLTTVDTFSLKTVLTLSSSLHKRRPKNEGKPGWVKNYPQCTYMLCSLLHCWLGMMQYMRSTFLLLLWCRCDLGSPFLPWVLCHKLGRSTFHLYQRRAEGSDPLFTGWKCTRCWNA